MSLEKGSSRHFTYREDNIRISADTIPPYNCEHIITYADKRHFDKSKKLITGVAFRAADAVPEGKQKKALILGAGHLNDIPTEPIIEKYDEITLVEKQPKWTASKIEKLHPKQQEKITLVESDVSGVAEETMNKLDAIPQDANIITFLRNATDIIRQAEIAAPSEVELGGPFSFVCSQLILSQLTYEVVDSIGDALQERYGINFDRIPDRLRAHLSKYEEVVSAAHIKTLKRNVAPSGRIYFADTFTIERDSMVNEENIQKVIHEEFDQKSLGIWTWNAGPEKLYGVKAFLLRPKQD